jgi:hypothetical protein
MAAPSVVRTPVIHQSDLGPKRGDFNPYGGGSGSGAGTGTGGGQATGGVRYIQGWRNAEQDRRPPPRVARIVSQDYELIKRTCLEQNALWEDPSFPAVDASIYPSSRQPLPFTWKRPGVSLQFESHLSNMTCVVVNYTWTMI